MIISSPQKYCQLVIVFLSRLRLHRKVFVRKSLEPGNFVDWRTVGNCRSVMEEETREGKESNHRFRQQLLAFPSLALSFPFRPPSAVSGLFSPHTISRSISINCESDFCGLRRVNADFHVPVASLISRKLKAPSIMGSGDFGKRSKVGNDEMKRRNEWNQSSASFFAD